MAFDSATQGRSASPHPLPSLPPSPSEADLGRRSAWDEHEIDDGDGDGDGDDHNDDEYDELENEPRTPTAHSARGTKGKGRGSAGPLAATYAEGGTDEALREIDGAQGHYPPTTDGDAETRRIEETLRRWEVAERQRRKSARDAVAAAASAAASASAASSSPTTAAAPSVVADVARRASHLWASRSSRAPTAGVGAHHALHTSDDADADADVDAVPLSTLAGPHALSPPLPLSPTPSRPPTPPSAATLTPETENPFRDPYGSSSSSSLFVNAQPPASTPPSASGPGAGAKPGFAPPEPLGLPQPRTPPPRTATPHANRPPEPMPPAALTRTGGRGARGGEEAGEKPVRWWTEWLCGCSEGPDRGGDAQAGRTNPLE
ncbi:hypothetical protein HETIRDRAFT_150441 [Heterobasidion irregulare TC 32-1]|uniref:Uncharacterized protein n=1 Tax=Heterobasidion irregulare (strain TC 32-1) TaxID=747525 RepID=W4K5T2_HETIT|nr:uncharacterized protein HETIRDRAFT_150441 [Heterobasidion irregulare TC 32-1]ETW80396.1 hypothetical protein HETIRDRAFT_150441 [Heterobasidion irregulare TC 32-1]